MNFLIVKKKRLTESIKIETKANVNNKKWLEKYELDINNHNKHYKHSHHNNHNYIIIPF